MSPVFFQLPSLLTARVLSRLFESGFRLVFCEEGLLRQVHADIING